MLLLSSSFCLVMFVVNVFVAVVVGYCCGCCCRRSVFVCLMLT